jgi:hypothetical protein
MSGRPGRANFREALAIYVREHDRIRCGEPTPEPGDRSSGANEEANATTTEASGPGAADGGQNAAATPRPRFGVGIPDRLDFHRGPATWRTPDAPDTRRPGGPDES